MFIKVPKPRHYLYLAQKDVFSDIPSGLLNAFGVPKFMMMFALSKHKTLPKVSVEKLEEALATTKGYFLRIDLKVRRKISSIKKRVYNGLKLLSKKN